MAINAERFEVATVAAGSQSEFTIPGIRGRILSVYLDATDTDGCFVELRPIASRVSGEGQKLAPIISETLVPAIHEFHPRVRASHGAGFVEQALPGWQVDGILRGGGAGHVLAGWVVYEG